MKKIIIFCFSLILSLSTFAQNTNRIEAAKGSCYGMTASGGNKGYGVVYHYRSGSNQDSVLVNLNGSGNGLGDPWGSVIQASNGRIYGMTYYGGTKNDGAIYSYNPVTGTDSIVVSFDSVNGKYPYGNLVQATNGWLYGMTEDGGKYGYGVIFCFNPSTLKDSVIVDLDLYNGAYPKGNLIQATDGKLYGMTYTGGTTGYGTIFRLDPVTGQDTILYNFTSSDGYGIYGSLYQASNGIMYGMSEFGGAHNMGALFSFDPVAKVETTLVSFDSLNGKGPYGNVMQATDGKLYGMTFYGGVGNNNAGVLFCYDITRGVDSVVWNLNAATGEYPLGTPMQAPNGLLYGMLAYGAGGYGVVYSFDIKTGKDSILVTMNSTTTGAYPTGDLILASNGEMYAMTYLGGLYNSGTLFKYNPVTGADSVLINMGTGGSNNGVIMQASNGMLYGMTELGGSNNQGTLFMYDPITGKDTVYVNFLDTVTGSYPYAGLVQAKDGLLYGLTSGGGKYQHGSLFSFDPVTNNLTQLFSFNGTDGAKPLGQLVQAKNGKLYGATWLGGSSDYGVIFSYDPKTAKDTVWVNYTGTNGQFGFLSSFMNGPGGYLYGVTYYGGLWGNGTLHKFDPNTGKDTILHDFYYYDGMLPQGVVVVDTPSHVLFGTATGGGTYGDGVLYGYNLLTGKDSIYINFDGAAHGNTPTGFLMQDSATGLIYGTTYNGGTYNFGTLYTFDPNTGKDSVLVNFNGTSGASPVSIIIAKDVLGVNNIKQDKQTIVVYPNPMTNVATVLFDRAGKHYIEMDDITGKRVKWISTEAMQCDIARDGLTTGVYLLKFYDDQQHVISSTRIVVK